MSDFDLEQAVVRDGPLRDVLLALRRLDERLDRLERRLLLVDELPDRLPFGALVRVRGDLTGTLYLGNGPNRPLTKLLPSPL